MVQTQWRAYRSQTALFQDAAHTVVKIAQQAFAASGKFRLVLAGGQTPRDLYRQLVQPELLEQLPWTNTHVFFGDERFVTSDHIHSNYNLARIELLSKVPIPEYNIHPIRTDRGSLQQCAAWYADELADHFGGPPRFDLVVLGMGSDGHTASLYPQDSMLLTPPWVLAVPEANMAPKVPRLTLSLGAINRAMNVCFLAWGKDKIRLAREIQICWANQTCIYPAGKIRAQRSIHWFVGPK